MQAYIEAIEFLMGDIIQNGPAMPIPTRAPPQQEGKKLQPTAAVAIAAQFEES